MLDETILEVEVTSFPEPQCPVTWLGWCQFNKGENIWDLGVLCCTVNNDTDLNNSLKDLEVLYLKWFLWTGTTFAQPLRCCHYCDKMCLRGTLEHNHLDSKPRLLKRTGSRDRLCGMIYHINFCQNYEFLGTINKQSVKKYLLSTCCVCSTALGLVNG
jgi:hypothetical protein